MWVWGPFKLANLAYTTQRLMSTPKEWPHKACIRYMMVHIKKTSKTQACPPNQLGAIWTVWTIDSLPTMGQVKFHHWALGFKYMTLVLFFFSCLIISINRINILLRSITWAENYTTLNANTYLGYWSSIS